MTFACSQQSLAILDIQVKSDMNTQLLTEHTTSDLARLKDSLKKLQTEPARHSILAYNTSEPIPNPNLVPFPDLLVRGPTESGCGLEPSDAIPARTGRVRFRSRVRITSGLNRQKRKSQSENDYMTFSSSSSSLSGSPSSSISAPLRVDTAESVGKPGWGTLGQRVSLLARPRRQYKESRSKESTRNKLTGDVNERTPLVNQGSSTHGAETELGLAQESEAAFGPWPRRLANPHWWWWHLEPVVCCHYLVESDDEG